MAKVTSGWALCVYDGPQCYASYAVIPIEARCDIIIAALSATRYAWVVKDPAASLDEYSDRAYETEVAARKALTEHVAAAYREQGHEAGERMARTLMRSVPKLWSRMRELASENIRFDVAECGLNLTFEALAPLVRENAVHRL